MDPHLMPDRPAAGLDESVTSTVRILERQFRRGEADPTAALDGLSLTLLDTVARRAKELPREDRPGFLDRVLERMRDDVGSDAELSSLAETAGVSAEHLARTFARRWGSPSASTSGASG